MANKGNFREQMRKPAVRTIIAIIAILALIGAIKLMIEVSGVST